MAEKVYLVQTWGEDGVRSNHYETIVDSPKELRELSKFLRTKFSHVTLTLTKPRAPKKTAR